MKYKVGIICAGDKEVAPILPMVEGCSISEKAMLKFYNGKIEGIEVVTLFSGVCKTNAAIATQILIDSYGCNAIINAGTAGGMDIDIKLFDTIISTESAYWDVSKEILTEFHPWTKSIYFQADKGLLEYAKKAVTKNKFSNVHFGRVITGETFIDDKYRSEINEKYSPLSVDMETASIAHVCYVNKIPYLAVRTITDTAEHAGLDEFELNCSKASLLSTDIVKAILRELLDQ
jgi:adenosylhomocysteine nucleosidase